VIGQYKGYRFKDNRSWVNSDFADVEAVAKSKYDTAKAAEIAAASTAGRAVAEWATHNFTNELFKPDYFYRLKKAEDVKKYVLANAGAGKL
jgi:pectate lyase